MSFDTRTGTRGRRLPGTGGPIGRWAARRVINRIRRKGKVPQFGLQRPVLTTIGRKSGLQRQTPVGWFPGGKVAVTAEQLHGSEREEAWGQITAASSFFGDLAPP